MLVTMSRYCQKQGAMQIFILHNNIEGFFRTFYFRFCSKKTAKPQHNISVSVSGVLTQSEWYITP